MMGRQYSKAQILRLLKIKESVYYNAHKKGIFKYTINFLVTEEGFVALKTYLEQKGTGRGRPKSMAKTASTEEVIYKLNAAGVTKSRLAKELNVSRQAVSYNLKKGLSDKSAEEYKAAITRIVESGDLEGVYPDGYKVRTRGISRASKDHFYIKDRIVKFKKEGLALEVIAQRISKSKSETARLWKEIVKAEPDVLSRQDS